MEYSQLEEAHDNLLFLVALVDSSLEDQGSKRRFPLASLMKCTHLDNGEIAFPLGLPRRAANTRVQNYKKILLNRSNRTKEKIEELLECDPPLALQYFPDNPPLLKLAEEIQNHKKTMTSRGKKMSQPKQQYRNPSFTVDSEEEYDDRDDDYTCDESFTNTPVQPRVSSTSKNQVAFAARTAGTNALSVYQSPPAPLGLKKYELLDSTDGDANVLGLMFTIANSYRLKDNATGYVNYARITMSLPSHTDFENYHLKLVPGHPDQLEMTFPSTSAAIKADFELIEADLEAEFQYSNEGNPHYPANGLTERLHLMETRVAKSEGQKNKQIILILPFDPVTGSRYTVNNKDWQGETFQDTHIEHDYLRKYKVMVEVDKEEMVGSDMMMDGVPPPKQFRHYICWMLPCSGNKGDKLVTKSPKKTQLDYKSKQDKMSEMMSRLKLAGKGP